MTRLIVFFLFGFAFTQVLSNNEISGKVIEVIDGNTIEVLAEDKTTYKIVFAGVDSPELTQEFGERAKQYLEKMLLKQQVHVQFQGKDRKGNYIAVVIKDKLDPRVELLKEGLAWTSEKDPLPELESIRVKAQQRGKGLWKTENPTPPWIYRRQVSMMQPKSS